MRTTFATATIAALLVSGLLATSPAGAATTPAAFAPIAFLIGDWVGSGTSDAGAGSGGDSFDVELGGHVVMRHAHSSYPGANGSPATTYEGLMVVYSDPSAPAGLRADSFDSGGHAIQYVLAAGTAPNVAQFVSEGTTARPTFRLTYTLHGAGDLDVNFELAPPGSATFQTVAHGTEHRQA